MNTVYNGRGKTTQFLDMVKHNIKGQNNSSPHKTCSDIHQVLRHMHLD